MSEKKKYNEKLLNWRLGLIEKYVTTGDRVLDMGAGTRWVSKRLGERKNCEITLVDVLDCNETDLPLDIYDGKTLPYGDNEFDVTLLVFVLHHVMNQEQVLQEAARVCRKRIIIVEDTPKNLFERAVERFCDTALSIEHGFAAPHNFRRIEQWGELFSQLNLRLANQDVVKPFFPFYYTKAVFVLDLS
jgi:ubiquinone/menaquinone biosynthesis C-methylase UbiE